MKKYTFGMLVNYDGQRVPTELLNYILHSGNYRLNADGDWELRGDNSPEINPPKPIEE